MAVNPAPGAAGHPAAHVLVNWKPWTPQSPAPVFKALMLRQSSSHWTWRGSRHTRHWGVVLALLMLSLRMECLLPFFYQKTIYLSSFASNVTFFWSLSWPPAREINYSFNYCQRHLHFFWRLKRTLKNMVILTRIQENVIKLYSVIISHLSNLQKLTVVTIWNFDKDLKQWKLSYTAERSISFQTHLERF